MLGKVAREIRESMGLSIEEAAQQLGISRYRLTLIEYGLSEVNADVARCYLERWGKDLNLLAWLLYSDARKLPESVRKAADELTEYYRRELNNEP